MKVMRTIQAMPTKRTHVLLALYPIEVVLKRSKRY